MTHIIFCCLVSIIKILALLLNCYLSVNHLTSKFYVQLIKNILSYLVQILFVMTMYLFFNGYL